MQRDDDAAVLPEGAQRVTARLAELGHRHTPVMLADSARTAQDAADALGYVGAGHTRGKVVVVV